MPTITLQSARTRVSVEPEYGGRVAQLAIRDGDGWLPLLHDGGDRPASEREPLGWGAYPLAPWPNRIEHGRFSFDGRAFAVPVTRDGHALHGFGATAAWTVEDASDRDCVLSLRFDER